jgi:hypothetical protein
MELRGLLYKGIVLGLGLQLSHTLNSFLTLALFLTLTLTLTLILYKGSLLSICRERERCIEL